MKAEGKVELEALLGDLFVICLKIQVNLNMFDSSPSSLPPLFKFPNMIHANR